MASDTRVERVLEAITADLANRVSRRAAARIANLGPVYFSKRLTVGASVETQICKDRRVGRVLLVITRDLTKRLSREDAARVASLDPAYFSKRFRGAMGVTFAVWNTAIRVREAQRLLESTDFQVREVAAAVGYEDVTTFERNFRRLLGLSPRAYRVHATTQSAGND